MSPPQVSAHCKRLPSVPQAQFACHPCDTFSRPPLDGSLCISELYEWHARNSPNHPLFQYLEEDGSAATISYKDATRAMHRGGLLLKAAIEAAQPQSKRPIIAVLSLSEIVSYTLTWLSAERAGFILFPISPRNSPAAIAHLLTQVRVDMLLVGKEAVVQDLANATFEHLRALNVKIPPAADMLVFDDLFPSDEGDVELLPPVDHEPEDVSFILHSSGTTGFPKPIKWSRFGAITLARVIYYSEVDMTGMRISIHSLPIYHGLGIIQSFWAASTGIILVCNKPSSPPRVPTPSEMLRDADILSCDLLICTPNFAEAWAKHPEEVAMLKRTRGIIFGGGPLGKETGDFLLANGVAIHQLCGSTESGTINTIMRRDYVKDWEYFSFAKQVNVHWVPDENTPGVSKLVIMAGDTYSPTVLNCTIDGVDAFDTSDLYVRHPTNPNLWKIYGRADDQIVHSIGEKTNPGPLEAILNTDTHIAHCLMFGRGHFNAGVLVDPKTEFKFDPQDKEQLAEFRNMIWPTVEKLNNDAPKHSRIFKEMILVASPNKSFTFTAKGTPRRQAIIAEYAPEIEALYASVEESTQADLPAPRSWDVEQTNRFIRNLVTNILGRSLGDAEDLFQHGCDSLQATWIRNSVLHALRTASNVDTGAISSNIIYDYPTISRLASYVASIACSGNESGRRDTSHSAINAMHKMVEKYSQGFPIYNPQHDGVPIGDTILVTGTTGGLGCALLSQLSRAPEVVKIYALNRTGKRPLEERQRESLHDRGYDAETILRSSKVVLLEADLVQPTLGLSGEVYVELQNSVTHIVHNAWPVNFNLNLGFFDLSIRGLRNLIDLALKSPNPTPPRLLFISSIGVLRHSKRDQRIKEDFFTADWAVGTGYSESKWVGEQLLAVASRETSLSTISLRVGQIAGSDNGAWNVHEWVPSLIKSSIHLGCVPMFAANVSWMNASTFASAVLEARNMSTKLSPLHLAHPRPVSWNTLFAPVVERYHLLPVSYAEWYTKLATSEASSIQKRHDDDRQSPRDDHSTTLDNLTSNPALKLISFFGSCNESITIATKENSPHREAMAFPYMDVTKCATIATKGTFSEQNLQSLGPDDMRRWLGYWEGVGYMPSV